MSLVTIGVSIFSRKLQLGTQVRQKMLRIWNWSMKALAFLPIDCTERDQHWKQLCHCGIQMQLRTVFLFLQFSYCFFSVKRLTRTSCHWQTRKSLHTRNDTKRKINRSKRSMKRNVIHSCVACTASCDNSRSSAGATTAFFRSRFWICENGFLVANIAVVIRCLFYLFFIRWVRFDHKSRICIRACSAIRYQMESISFPWKCIVYGRLTERISRSRVFVAGRIMWFFFLFYARKQNLVCCVTGGRK